MEYSTSTLCVHSGTQHPEEGTRGINSPVYVSTSFAYLNSEERIYPRYFNTPNQQAIIDKLCALEHAEAGLFLSSGMAAESTVLLTLLKSGDHAVFQPALYGGTFHLAVSQLAQFGISHTIADSCSVKDMEKAIRPNTRLLYMESPSNPLLEITDIEAIAVLAHKRGIASVIDNTFASPVNQNPIDLGVDIVLHSATKYLGGHSDICAGAIVAKRQMVDKLKNMALSLGGSLNALDCYLLERSMKTLVVRVERQNMNAMKIARYLEMNQQIAHVFYPGLERHPNHAIARQQMKGFGGMLSFELKTIDPVIFQKNLKLISPSMSLGGVETITCSPALTSHRHLTEEERKRAGISEKLMRLSVGIEDADDLIRDLEQALR
jgi:cysteine-S-conjugate beta-lyase